MMDFALPYESDSRQNDVTRRSVVGTAPVAIDPAIRNRNPVSLASVQLPPIESDSFMSSRHEVNPAIALNTIQDIQSTITRWQTQQRQVISAMRTLYAQGPMVDGWIQSSPASQPVHPSVKATQSSESRTILRHGDADALMKYVEAIESGQSSALQFSSSQHSASPAGSARQIETAQVDRTAKGDRDVYSSASASVDMSTANNAAGTSPANTSSANTSPANTSQYWLCCLQDDGSVHSQICPPEQMAVIGTAIARFQKFKQLKLQQQQLEGKLQKAVDMLSGIRAAVCE